MFHDTFFAEAAQSCPTATCLVSAAFPKMTGLKTQTVSEGFPEAWRDEVIPVDIEGMPRVQETVFYDRQSETLIVSDLMFFFDAEYDAWTRGFVRLAGMYGQPRMSRLFRWFIKDRGAFKDSIKPLLDLPIRQILPSHGKAITKHGNQVLQTFYEQID